MATQNSQLIENLNLIYNEKLAQKTVLETTSDDFLMYHTYIAALKPSGYTSILQNGQVDVSSYKYAYVSVDGGGIVPVGSYTITTNGEYDVYNYATAVVEVDSSIPEGYVLPSGNIDLIQNGMVDVKEYAYATVAMPVPTGTVNITENGTAIDVSQYASANVAVPIPSGYVLPSGILEINENVIAADCSSYQYVTVDVEGGGSGEAVDPYHDAIGVVEMIDNGDTSADYVSSCIMSDFTSSESKSKWKETDEMDTGQVDSNDEPIYEEKAILFVVNSDGANGAAIATALGNYPDLYEHICPIIKNATLTASENPQSDGYDYLLEGDLYAWNLGDMNEPVQEITENGFYPNDVALGFDVNIEPTYETPDWKGPWVFINADRESDSSYGPDGIVILLYRNPIYWQYTSVVYQECDTETESHLEVNLLNYSGSSTPEILIAKTLNGDTGGDQDKCLTRVRGVKTKSNVRIALTSNRFIANTGSSEENININDNDNLVDFSTQAIELNSSLLDGVHPIYFYLRQYISNANNKPIVLIYNYKYELLVEGEDYEIVTLNS